MWLGVAKWLASFLTGPILDSALKAYQAKLAAGTSHDTLAAGLATQELQLQMREMELQTQLRIAEIGKWYEPDHVIGYAVAFIVSKILVWDMCLGLGSTPEPKGWIATVSTAVVMAYFGKRTFENVTKLWKR